MRSPSPVAAFAADQNGMMLNDKCAARLGTRRHGVPSSATRKVLAPLSDLSRGSWGARGGAGRAGYVLLETVIATGLLIVGLAVIGGQVQDAQRSIRHMQRSVYATMLAEQHLAELDLGLVELDSVDEVDDGDFGPRHPDFGWVVTTDKTAIAEMYLLKLEILYYPREGEYREDDFEIDSAETVYTVYAMRASPQPLDLGEEFGLSDDQMVELSEKLSGLGIEGLDPEAFDPTVLGKIDFEELLEALPVIMDAFGMELSDMASTLPPNLLQQLQESGLLGEEEASQLLGGLGKGEPKGQ